jgi:uncharacterized protein (DUF1778 family)
MSRTQPDAPTASDAEKAAFYEANAERVDELFDTEHPIDVTPNPDLGMVVSVRLKAQEVEALSSAAAAAGKRLSVYIREAALEAASSPERRERDQSKVRLELLVKQATVSLERLQDGLDNAVVMPKSGRDVPSRGRHRTTLSKDGSPGIRASRGKGELKLRVAKGVPRD